MNKELQEKYLKNIENNVNVGKINTGFEFIILIVAFSAIIGTVWLFSDSIINICIDNMSNETQIKLEKMIGFKVKNTYISEDKNIEKLNDIKDKIISMDSKLQGKSNFPIQIIKNNELNAAVTPNGRIFITSKLADTIKDEEMLTFILAHELGHYANRDHLKMFGKEIAKYVLTTMLSGGNNTMETTLIGISDFHNLKYSRKQEKKADKYASQVVYKLYGSTKGGINFFNLLKNKENLPLFMEYLSTHPSTESRIREIKKFKRD